MCLIMPAFSCRDVNRVNEEWFTDTNSLREKVGLLDEQPSGSSRRKVRLTFLIFLPYKHSARQGPPHGVHPIMATRWPSESSIEALCTSTHVHNFNSSAGCSGSAAHAVLDCHLDCKDHAESSCESRMAGPGLRAHVAFWGLTECVSFAFPKM